jgi:hypothetical protein
MSLVQGGSAKLPFQSVAGNTIAQTTPIMCDTTIPNALTTTGVCLLADYAMIADGGALARPVSCFPASLAFPMTVSNGTRLQLSLCEAEARIKAGAAQYS